ncbi:MAG TPA: multicopper oxidase domain-containing protein [Nocardioidaceae bacterium]|nr:multicopper oxidase domain-containing protein [Nocardioidaceae bacterium]
MEATRRDVLKFGALGVAGAFGAAVLPRGAMLGAEPGARLAAADMPVPFQMPFATPPVLRPTAITRAPDGALVEHFQVFERPGTVHILPRGLPTTFWGYNGITPGPTIKIHRERRSVLRVRNRLPATNPELGYESTTSVHLHGSPTLPQYDGYASDVSPTGFYKDYHYPNTEQAVTLWYHDHGVHHTAQNAYYGLAAQYHVHDELEMRLLPQGEFDVPLTVRDALFAADGSLGYDDNSTSGLWGDVILMNGIPWPVMRVKRRVYRFRMLAAGISRSFRFQLGDGDPVTMVGTDGGLMPRSQTVSQWRHGVAERYEFLVDFSRYRPGERVVLHNLSNPNNIDFANTDVVMAFDVTDAPFDKSDPTWNRIPDELTGGDPAMNLTPAQSVRTRRLEFRRQHGQWTINGETWEDVVASNFQQVIADPGLNDIEIWELSNSSGGWFHPVHIHLLEFQILDRNGAPPFDFERGPKDVAYVGEGETVRAIMQFAPHRGRYMIHCHNLVHEDHDMMHQFAVGWKPGQPDPNDPMLASPPQVDNLPPGR